MAEPSVSTPHRSGEVPIIPGIADRHSPQSGDQSTEEPDIDMHDGPDYVDDWMEKNLPPSLVDFVRNHCTSFARWDLLRHLHSDPLGATLESLTRTTGTAEMAVAAELRYLEAAGLVSRRDGEDSTIYHLRPASGLVQALEAAVQAYEEDREFRFALVYSIVRATHSGVVVE